MRRPIARFLGQRKAIPGSLPSSWTGFNPNNIENLYMWFDAADASTITASSGAVSQWNDKSSNGFNVSQGTGSAQPTTGSSTLNGLNVISFASNDQLTYSAASDALDFSPLTVFLVARYTATTNQFQRFFTSRRSATGAADFQSPNMTVQMNTATPVAIFVAAGTGANNGVTQNNYFLFDGVSNGSTVNASADMRPANVNNTGSIANQRYFRIGSECNSLGNPPIADSSGFLTGDIAEIILYNRELTLSERRAVRQYLQKKWRAPSVVPLGYA